MKLLAAAAAALLLATPAIAQTPPAQTPPAQTVQPVEDMAWMTGEWVAKVGQTTYREAWLAPVDGVMGGVSVANGPGRKPMVETIKITTEAAGPTFTSLIPGQPPLVLVRLPGPPGGDAIFEREGDAFPKRLILKHCGPDLCARAEGTREGKPFGLDWHFKRPQ